MISEKLTQTTSDGQADRTTTPDIEGSMGITLSGSGSMGDAPSGNGSMGGAAFGGSSTGGTPSGSGSMNDTPSSERIHIGLFGRRNAGKSSLLNALTGQSMAIVSDTPGTTTDPVKKAMELLPLGPVLLIDTPGIDDVGALGRLRVEKAMRFVPKTDIALLVTDASWTLTKEETVLLDEFKNRDLPYLIVRNKVDLTDSSLQLTSAASKAHSEKPLNGPVVSSSLTDDPDREIFVSAKTGQNIKELKERIASLSPAANRPLRYLVRDLIRAKDLIVLVVPIDKAAPKGRLILPQQQTIRDILDAGAISLVVRDSELPGLMEALPAPPALVITDSQVFKKVAKIVPDAIPMTSFSILFARYKGDLPALVEGARVLDTLCDGDRVLISEGCTHHRQCDDIGTVKLPGWLSAYTQKKLTLSFTSGGEFPSDLSPYRLIIHCGGCMLNEKEMRHRLAIAKRQRIPMTNYGTAIAHMNGILERSLRVFQ